MPADRTIHIRDDDKVASFSEIDAAEVAVPEARPPLVAGRVVAVKSLQQGPYDETVAIRPDGEARNAVYLDKKPLSVQYGVLEAPAVLILNGEARLIRLTQFGRVHLANVRTRIRNRAGREVEADRLRGARAHAEPDLLAVEGDLEGSPVLIAHVG